MSCKWCEARLASLVDGELTPRDRSLVTAHVARCATCAALLSELRVIDGLLLTSREVRLAPNFTVATMAELHELPPPAATRPPIAALVVCYVVGCWLLVGAALLLSPDRLGAVAATVLDAARTVANALGGIGRVFARLAGWSLVIDVALLILFAVALRRVRPRLAKLLRS